MKTTRLVLILLLVALAGVPPVLGQNPAKLTVTLVRWPYT